MEEFLTEAEQSSDFGLDSDEYIRSVLNKALGEDKASGLLNRILQSRDASGIESLKWMDAPTVSEFIKNEHPQIIATILVHLDADQASEIIGYFPERMRQARGDGVDTRGMPQEKRCGGHAPVALSRFGRCCLLARPVRTFVPSGEKATEVT